MSKIKYQKDVAALYYACLGKKADSATLTFYANILSDGKVDQTFLVNKFIAALDGQSRYQNLNNEEKVSYVYQNITGAPAPENVVAHWSNELSQGHSTGYMVQNLVREFRDYNGSNPELTEGAAQLENTINASLYPAFDQGPDVYAAAADIQAIYYVIGGSMVAEGINFWAQALYSGQSTLSRIAQHFIETRPKTAGLSDKDFVKKIFNLTFKTPPNDAELAKYFAGLDAHTESRGEVVTRMIEDIRNDTTHPQAKEAFLSATHVYAAGQLPTAQYKETVAALYLSIAKSDASASTIDTYSKFLASGNSELALLKILAKSPQFSEASNFKKIYNDLYNFNGSVPEQVYQAILLKSGNDPLKATLLIIDSLRNGKYPLDNGQSPSPSLIKKFNASIGEALGYKEKAILTLDSNGGVLTGTINSDKLHALSAAEIASLKEITINANTDLQKKLDLSDLNGINKIIISGDYASNKLLLSSISAAWISPTLILDDKNIDNSGGQIDLASFIVDKKVFVKDDTDIANATLNLIFGAQGNSQLFWNGNATSTTGNMVSKAFHAKSDHFYSIYSDYLISANFFTKDIYTTTDPNGATSTEVRGNSGNFNYFSAFDLTNYIGKTNIYHDGLLTGTQDNKVFDFGLATQLGTVNGWDGLTVSGPVNDIHVINFHKGYGYGNDNSNVLRYREDAGEASSLHIEMAPITQSIATDIALTIRLGEDENDHINAGTLSLTTHYQGTVNDRSLNIELQGESGTLRLAGGDNSITNININGAAIDTHTLNLTIAADFSDSLTYVGTTPTADRYQDYIINLHMEKGGSGGGSFYQTLVSLNDNSPFQTVIDALAGEQLLVSGGNSGDNLQVMGNTTIIDDTANNAADIYRFTDSSIDNLVTSLTPENRDKILVGEENQQWIFGTGGYKEMAIYGSVVGSNALNTLFHSLDSSQSDSAQNMFSAIMDNVTEGRSQGQLSEVGILKIDKALYVIIDKNHNQAFDDNDIVFSLGDRDPYQTAVSLHYKSPPVQLTAEYPILSETL
ncbi:autotransporter outer membrane beta-barrel domain-containing protein [Serratia liquefaciens]|uniref:hypothetical protein n=1 Tax=Serratia liquefaciens TaxID=614 RepID=UPI00235F6BE8|nr:hypothetical protein [Serratia liquefaciens]